jgi:hypothetical protein
MPAASAGLTDQGASTAAAAAYGNCKHQITQKVASNIVDYWTNQVSSRGEQHSFHKI